MSLFYNGQSGRPYSVLFNTDVNADGTVGNDLLFVPASVNDVVVRGGTPEQLEAFIAGDEGLSANRGRIVPRNAEPHALDQPAGLPAGAPDPVQLGQAPASS